MMLALRGTKPTPSLIRPRNEAQAEARRYSEGTKFWIDPSPVIVFGETKSFGTEVFKEPDVQRLRSPNNHRSCGLRGKGSRCSDLIRRLFAQRMTKEQSAVDRRVAAPYAMPHLGRRIGVWHRHPRFNNLRSTAGNYTAIRFAAQRSELSVGRFCSSSLKRRQPLSLQNLQVTIVRWQSA
jgi:hypothetical protein